MASLPAAFLPRGVALSALLLLTGIGCGKAPSTQVAAADQTASTSTRVDIDAKQFQILMTKNDSVVLDVRTPREWALGRIPNAITLNLHESRFSDKVQNLPKDKAILVYCASGRRSVTASTRLLAVGFTRVYNLTGGLQGWKRAGLPQEGGR